MTNGSQVIPDIIKTAIAVLPFLALCFLSRKINLKKPFRNRQFLMPVFALVYIIVLLFTMSSINNWLLGILNKIPVWITSLLNMDWMPKEIAAFLAKPANALIRWIKSLDLSYWVFYISNTAVVLLYFAYKGVCIKTMKVKFKKKNALHDRISGFFYSYFPERDAWCIKDSFIHTRSLFKAIYYTVAILSSIMMVVSGRMYVAGLLASIYYPVAGVILIGELYFYLDGLSKKEFTQDILGEDEDAYKTVNYSLLRKYLRSLFGDKLLSENTGVNNALAYHVTNDEIIEKLADDADPAVVNFSIFYSNLNKSGFPIDHNYLNSSLDLLKGKSIIFNNPFYQDLIPYAFYPMNRALLSQKKVMVVLGRHAIENDIEQWLKDGIEAVTNIPFLWRIGVLDLEQQDLDIGIVTRSRVLDMQMHNANEEFLRQVGFVVVIEPSRLVSTAQIGLNLLVKKCRGFDDREIVYCMCDRNCDGLVDAMSHILMTSLTEVSATNKHLGTSSYMCWDADNDYLHHRLFPNVSRYLGFGTELSFAALKNQVSATYWYGGDVFPVTDIRWIDRQYYYDLMKYAALPTSQEAVDDYFHTSANMWSAQIGKNNYFTVEDESHNMFEMLRNFATRSTEQGFINVVSSDYLLKDYMASNDSIFEADAKAIPYLTADYARTHRNVILRLMLIMSTSQADEDTVRKEFSLIGLPTLDTREQLWHEIFKCLSSIEVILSLPEDYYSAVKETARRCIPSDDGLHQFDIDTIIVSDKYIYETGKLTTVYSISDYRFIEGFVNELKSSSYVAEDEKGERYFLGSELCGHIFQKYLPGQFFTFAGKYYEMRYLTSDNQVLVRRAADHISGRPEYRQLRSYTISAIRPSTRIGSIQDIEGIKIIKEYADITVSTPGYYRMSRYQDFKTAKKVLYEGEQSRIPDRVYKNKSILRIDLPLNDGAYNEKVRYTITLLMNEVFRTLFADNHPYIAALTDDSHLESYDGCRPLTYSIRGDGVQLPKASIYIIEDSQIDIGLLITVERNLRRIFEIIHDYLSWNKKEIFRSLNPPPEEKPLQIKPEDIGEYTPPKKDCFFMRLWKAIKRFFSRKKKKPEESAVPQEPVDNGTDNTTAPVPPAPDPSSDISSTDTDQEPTPSVAEPVVPGGDLSPEKEPEETEPDPAVYPAGNQTEDTAEESIDEQPEADAEESTADDQSSDGSIPPAPPQNMPSKDDDMVITALNDGSKSPYDFTRLPYHQRYYLLYGYSGEPDIIDANSALSYLSQLGFATNPLREARRGKRIAKYVEATFKPNKKNARYCDFCGSEIFGVEYETISDGRDRCISCGRTAVKTEEEFRRIFEDVKRNLESFFGIKINTGIRVEMVNSQKLHKKLNQAFIPTPGVDGRVLGVAINDKNGYTLMIENGSPRISAMLTIAHELTHIWQYLNWKDKDIIRKYGKKLRLEIYEGMAKWVEIQYAYLINEPSVAKREEIITVNRNDEYGNGFIRYKAAYPLSTGTVIKRDTPFMNVAEPLNPMYCGDVAVMLDPNNGARGYDDDDEDFDRDDLFDDDIESIDVTPAVKDTYLRTPDSAPMYAYEHLSEREKELYDLFYQALINFDQSIDTIPEWVTQADLSKARDYVLRDHPEIYWFNGSIRFSYEPESGKVTKCELPYCLTRSDVEKRNDLIEASLTGFLSNITGSMSDYDVALAVYQNVIDLVDYDSLELERLANKPSDDMPDDLRSIYGVFVNKRAVCAGYAKAVQYLFNRLGIECTYITGEGEKGPHAWNLVKLSGDYYYIDVTWDDHSDTKKTDEASNEITYDYFCITTEDLLRDHTPDDTLPLPVCSALACNYYYRNGLLLDDYSLARVRAIIKSKVIDGVYSVPFKAKNKAVYDSMYASLIGEKKLGEIVRYLNLEPATRVSVSYAYSHSEKKLKITVSLNKV